MIHFKIASENLAQFDFLGNIQKLCQSVDGGQAHRGNDIRIIPGR